MVCRHLQRAAACPAGFLRGALEVRGAWIGWDYRHQYDRLHLIANNSRFLILPEHHAPNLHSRGLVWSERRLAQDWRERFGYRLLLL